jgi:hypothetical protein
VEPFRAGSAERVSVRNGQERAGKLTVTPLDDEFEEIAICVRMLIDLLEEAEEPYWIPQLQRSLAQVIERRLSGVTFVLGCYGGADTFSDLVIGRRWETGQPLKFRNLNARLSILRTKTFDAANAVTSRRSW